MALINCSECGRDVSAKALACPGCGHPISSSAPDQVLQTGADQKAQRQHTSAEWAIAWLLAAMIPILALVLNPSEAQHHAKIKATVEARHPATSVFGLSQLATIDSKYESYGLVSFTSNRAGIVSVGLYGYVHVLGK